MTGGADRINPVTVDVVIPSIGRPSLCVLLDSLAAAVRNAAECGDGLRIAGCYIVDDRPSPQQQLELGSHEAVDVTVCRGHARGPAAARNVGWRSGSADWVVFVDDDVQLAPTWCVDVHADLLVADVLTAAVQAIIEVPLPADRPANDAERNTAGLVTARWITADMAVRRSALVAVNGFDERFEHAFRKDSDLALRLQDKGYRLTRGRRRTAHPARRGSWTQSVRQQRGNADDVLMRRLHGRTWRSRCGAALGRRPQHLLTTAALAGAVCGVLKRRRRWAVLAASVWAACYAEFSWRRIAPGPRDRAEVVRMLATSGLIPPVASWYWLRQMLSPVPAPWQPVGLRRVDTEAATAAEELPAAVLFDRDGTLVVDVPYNGDPDRVELMPRARSAVHRLRELGIPIAVVTNQSGIACGLLTRQEVDAVNARVEELLGPFDGWLVCPHGESDGCSCRKPLAGLIRDAAAALGVPAERCVVIGDIGADVRAAHAAGAASVLVPTARTRAEEVASAARTAPDLLAAVELILAGRPVAPAGLAAR
jgi:histidinol-phosphate phosphatase family protein